MRDIANPAGANVFRTRLSYINSKRRRATLSYADIVRFGADETVEYFSNFEDAWGKTGNGPCRPTTPKHAQKILRANRRGSLRYYSPFVGISAKKERAFFWLHRSEIKRYDRESQMWQKWLVRIALAMQAIKTNESRNWTSGLTVYDMIADHTLDSHRIGSSKTALMERSLDVPPKIEDLPTYKKFMKPRRSFFTTNWNGTIRTDSLAKGCSVGKKRGVLLCWSVSANHV